MRKVLIVTDSCSDLEYNKIDGKVFVMPFYMRYFGYSPEFQRDNIYDYRRNLQYHDALVETIGANYCEIVNVLNYAVDYDMDVIVLHTSKHFNLQNSVAFDKAVSEFKEHNPNLNIANIDSGNIGSALGLLVEDLNELAEEGATFEELLLFIKENMHLYKNEFIVDYAEYLKTFKGVKNIDRVLLRLSDMKRIFTVDDGKIAIASGIPEKYPKLDLLIDRYLHSADLDHKCILSQVYNDFESEYVEREIKYMTGKDVHIIEPSRVTSSIIKAPSLCLSYKKKTSHF